MMMMMTQNMSKIKKQTRGSGSSRCHRKAAGSAATRAAATKSCDQLCSHKLLDTKQLGYYLDGPA